MVSGRTIGYLLRGSLSVLALSSRFDGPTPRPERHNDRKLSVLALSSRFDGPLSSAHSQYCIHLSVLALSSRFDGPSVRSGRRF